jgi:hypothetical protein
MTLAVGLEVGETDRRIALHRDDRTEAALCHQTDREDGAVERFDLEPRAGLFQVSTSPFSFAASTATPSSSSA